MSETRSKPPQHIEVIAKSKDRDYITPEDVQDALDADAPRIEVWDELLAILGKQRGLGAEDAGLCCFVAREHNKHGVPGWVLPGASS